jgi:hypothetical protein
MCIWAGGRWLQMVTNCCSLAHMLIISPWVNVQTVMELTGVSALRPSLAWHVPEGEEEADARVSCVVHRGGNSWTRHTLGTTSRCRGIHEGAVVRDLTKLHAMPWADGPCRYRYGKEEDPFGEPSPSLFTYQFCGFVPHLCSGGIASVCCSRWFAIPTALGWTVSDFNLGLQQQGRLATARDDEWVQHAGGLLCQGIFAVCGDPGFPPGIPVMHTTHDPVISMSWVHITELIPELHHPLQYRIKSLTIGHMTKTDNATQGEFSN